MRHRPAASADLDHAQLVAQVDRGLVEHLVEPIACDQERPLERRDVDLGRLVHDAVTDARAAAPEREVVLDVAERVTERLFRADPARSRHRGGSGLDRSIVDATFRARGGTVTIDNTPGEGTIVRLVVPAQATAATT